MSNFHEMVQELKAGSKGTNFSRTDLNGLAMAMFNDCDTPIPVYVKKGETFEKRDMYPGRALRTQFIAPILKAYGVDRAEMSSLSQVQTTRAGGEALADFSLMLVKQYISDNGLGRKLTLPMCSPNETVQSISTVKAEEEKRKTTMIVREGEGPNEVYHTTPTGKIVTTKAHEKIKVSNRVPNWLKDTVEDPDAAK